MTQAALKTRSSSTSTEGTPTEPPRTSTSAGDPDDWAGLEESERNLLYFALSSLMVAEASISTQFLAWSWPRTPLSATDRVHVIEGTLGPVTRARR